MNDCLLLHNPTLSLSDFTASVSVELEPSIVSVSDHRAEAEESRRGVCSGIDRRDRNRRDQVHERPNRAKDHLDLDPRDSEKALNHVEHVEDEQDAGEPETNHRNRIKVSSTCEVCIFGNFNADETDKVENLGGVAKSVSKRREDGKFESWESIR